MQHGQAILAWALATVRATLPPAVRNLGQHPDARLYRVGSDGRLVTAGLRYRSILGELSLGATESGRPPRRVEIELPAADQYRCVLNISESAARRGRPALALRLHEFSPIPVEQADFDFRLLTPREAGGYEAEVSVVRRARLQELRAQLPADTANWSFVGAVDPVGQAGFCYASGNTGKAQTQFGTGPALLATIAACVLVCLAWSDRFSRQADTLELRRTELIGFARDLRDADLAIERAERARQAGSATVPLGRVVATLRTLGLEQPEGLAIQTLMLDPAGTLTILGPEADAEVESGLIRLDLPLEPAP